MSDAGSVDVLPMETMSASLPHDGPDGDSGRDDDDDDDDDGTDECCLIPPPPPPYTRQPIYVRKKPNRLLEDPLQVVPLPSLELWLQNVYF